MKFKRYIILLFLVVTATCHAHKDRIFACNNGIIQNLPKVYEPATFSVTTKLLKIGKCSVKIPDSLWEKFGDINKDPIKFTGSWYHRKEKGGLPNYISLRNSKFKLLLNLDTLEIIQMKWLPKISEEELKEWNKNRKS